MNEEPTTAVIQRCLDALNLKTDELLDGAVGGLLTALRTVRPWTVRQFFALANQRLR